MSRGRACLVWLVVALASTASMSAQGRVRAAAASAARLEALAWSLLDLDRAIRDGSLTVGQARARHAELVTSSCRAVSAAADALRRRVALLERGRIATLAALEQRAAAAGASERRLERVRSALETLRRGADLLRRRADDLDRHVPLIRMTTGAGADGLRLALGRYLLGVARSLASL